MCSRKVNTGGKIARPRAKFKPLLRKEKDKEGERERGKGLETPLYGVIIHLDYFWREYYATPLSAGGYPSPRKTHVLLHAPRHRRRPLILLARSLRLDRNNFFNRVCLLSFCLVRSYESTV